MADLNVQGGWPGIYQLEEQDPVHGGPPDLDAGEGFDNVPHLQLAQRTAFLRAEVEALQQIVTGSEILERLLPVDGPGSGLNADLLDGSHLSDLALFRPGDLKISLSDVPDAGFLPLDGSEILREVYPELMARSGPWLAPGSTAAHAVLTDMRGLFLRVWDDGRGIDPGRALGTFQDHAVQRHNHRLPTSEGADNLYGVVDTQWRSGANAFPTSGAVAVTYDQGFDTGTAGQSAGTFADETRSVNISINLSIKF